MEQQETEARVAEVAAGTRATMNMKRDLEAEIAQMSKVAIHCKSAMQNMCLLMCVLTAGHS